MNKKEKYSVGFIITIILLIFLVSILIFFAFKKYYGRKPIIHYNEVVGGSVNLTYSDDSNIFSLNNYIPMDDITGMKLDSDDLMFDFTIKTIVGEANKINYDIYLSKENISDIKDEYIKIYLEKEIDGSYISVVPPINFKNNIDDSSIGDSIMKLYSNNRTVSGNDNYRLRLWVSNKAVNNINKNYAVKVLLKGNAN